MNASHLINANVAAHSVNGYTSWHMVCDAHEKTIRALVADLNVFKGIGLQPQTGSHHATLTLDGADVLVEYDYTPGEAARLYGPPEDCYEGSDEELTLLNVYVNGAWIDASLFCVDQLDKWDEELHQQWADARESDLEDRAAARAADREYA